METKNNRHANLFFPGAEVLYPILSAVCLFFFFFFFGEYKYNIVLKGKHPEWRDWYVFAILGFLFFALWGTRRKWWDGRFPGMVSFILYLSFLILQTDIFHTEFFNLIVVTVDILILCPIFFFRKILKDRGLSWLPFLIVVVYYVSASLFLTQLSCLISLVILAIVTTNKGKYIKIFTSIGIVIFYLLSIWFYCPISPFLYDKNIKLIRISSNPRCTDLLVEEDNKFIILDGSSLKRYNLVNLEFDCCDRNPQEKVLWPGFKTEKYKEYENDKIKQLDFIAYPLYVTDSCVYFTPRNTVFRILDGFKESNNSTERLTATVLQDFIDLYHNNNDSVNLKILQEHQAALQEEIEKVSFDTLKLLRNDENIETKLQHFSRNLCLATLNALSSDLVINKDINSAVKIFSLQFFETFYTSDIYKDVNLNFNIAINRSTENQKTNSTFFHVTDSDLRREDTFEFWTHMLDFNTSMIELYFSSLYQEKNKQIAELLRTNSSYVSTQFTTGSITNLINSLEEVMYVLNNDEAIPTISNYNSKLQHFLSQCIVSNYFPDYNSFFINRFNSIEPLFLSFQSSSNYYVNKQKVYEHIFDRDTSELRKINLSLDSLSKQAKTILSLRDSIDQNIQKLNLPPQLNDQIKELFYMSALSKK